MPIDLNDETTLKTLRVIDVLNRYRNKKISLVLERAFGKSKASGHHSQTPQTTTDAATKPKSELEYDYRSR